MLGPDFGSHLKLNARWREHDILWRILPIEPSRSEDTTDLAHVSPVETASTKFCERKYGRSETFPRIFGGIQTRTLDEDEWYHRLKRISAVLSSSQ